MKYFLSICILGLIANSSLAGVMPEETSIPKIKQIQTKSKNLIIKIKNLKMRNKVNFIKLITLIFTHTVLVRILLPDKDILINLW